MKFYKASHLEYHLRTKGIKMKDIDVIGIVLNGEPFVHYWLENTYKYAKRIFIVEGADNRTRDHTSREFFTPEGHSTDNSVEIIKSFPDPEHKIRLIQHPNNTFWTGGKEEMFSMVDSLIQSPLVLEQDIDEFYKHEDIQKLCDITDQYPQITGFGIPWRNFWHSPKRMFGWENKETFKVEWGFWAWRMFVWEPGISHFISHRPPNVSLSNGRNGQSLAWGPGHLSPLDIYTYHYSDLLPRQNLFKSQYYEIPQWYNNIFMKWLTNKEAIEAYGIYPLGGSGKTMEYHGTHPPEIYKMAEKLGMEI